MTGHRISIFVLGPSALPVAQAVKSRLGGQIAGPQGLVGCDIHYDKATHAMAHAFQSGHAVVGICASGILIRALAPFLVDKHAESPVIAVAEDGSSVVPLLGGHHGANDLAQQIAAAFNGHAAITTASELRFGEAFDLPPEGYVLGNPDAMKSATSAKLRGEDVERLITVHTAAGGPTQVVFHPQVLAVGIGCERGTSADEVKNLLQDTLAKHNLSPHAIAAFGSIDVKQDEPAITQFPNVRYFTAEALKAESHRIASPSPVVEQEVGTPSVAEAAALALIGDGAELIVPKTKSRRATLAIAKAKEPGFEVQGQRRGTVSVVGIGPGHASTISPAVDNALWQATDWVGYTLYLDLVEHLRNGQTRHTFPLGGEEDRCRHAIALAGQGKNVALVCSGDAGIYAMAALVYELIDREPTRIAVEVHPGISAFQMASAKAGAMIGHDFCCISLSDLLTPWETIEQRLKAAAEGDFVISFYNPRSLKRTDQIDRAFAILKPYRNADTPVILASSLGRPEENVRIIRFDEFKSADVDMLTLVMVGSTQSKTFTRGDGRTYAYTPRGYAKKMSPL